MNKALIYARVSSKDQEQEGFSIPSQIKTLKEYALRNNFQIVQEFIDVETAKRTGRNNFNAMIALAKKHKNIKAILCEKTDRLTRNFRDTATIDDLINDYDKKVILVKENTILEKNSKSTEKLMFGFKALISKNYIDNLSEESRKGMLEKAEQGHYPSLAPIGYKNVAVKDNNKNIKVLKVDQQKASIIKQLFEKYAKRNCSLSFLVQFAYDQGLRNRNGGKVPKSAIHKMLNSTIYYGEFKWAGKTIQGKHEPIISRSLFNDVQDAFASHNRPKQTKRQFLFSGLMKCSLCGCAITPEFKKKKYVYYHCTNYHKKHTTVPFIPEHKLPDMFGELIKKVTLTDDVYQWLTLLWKEKSKDKIKTLEEQVKILNTDKNIIDNQLNRLYDLFIDGKIPEVIFNSKKEKLERNFTDIKSRIENIKPISTQIYQDGANTIELCKNLYSEYVTSNLDKKVKIIKTVLQNSSLNDVTLCATYRKPFSFFNEKGFCSKKLPREDSNLGPNGYT